VLELQGTAFSSAVKEVSRKQKECYRQRGTGRSKVHLLRQGDRRSEAANYNRQASHQRQPQDLQELGQKLLICEQSPHRNRAHMSLPVQIKREGANWAAATQRTSQGSRAPILELSLLPERVSVAVRVYSALRIECLAVEV